MDRKRRNARLMYPKKFIRLLWLSVLWYSAASAAAVYQVDDISLSDLGRGFNQYTENLLGKCVSGVALNKGSVQSDIRFLGSGGYSRRSRQMYGKLSGEVDFFLFGGGASVEISTKLSNTDRSFSSVLELAVDGGGVSLEGRQELPVGTEQCGDEFIYHIKLGQKLYLSTKIYFSSLESYKKYVKTIKVKILFFKKKKTFVDEVSSVDRNARYVIELVSPNRLPVQLTNIVTHNRTNCKITNISECLLTSEKLFSYIFSPTGYGSDIKTTDYVPVSVETKSYTESGHWNVVSTSTPLDPRLQQWEQKIKDILVKRMGMRDYSLATCENTAPCLALIEKLNGVIQLGNSTLNACRFSELATCETQYLNFLNVNNNT